MGKLAELLCQHHDRYHPALVLPQQKLCSGMSSSPGADLDVVHQGCWLMRSLSRANARSP